jgi:hypothetical protein
MLNYFRETQEARFATPARRMYGYLSAGIVVAVMALVFAGLAPLWISWATFAASCVPFRTLGLEILPRLPVLLRPQTHRRQNPRPGHALPGPPPPERPLGHAPRRNHLHPGPRPGTDDRLTRQTELAAQVRVMCCAVVEVWLGTDSSATACRAECVNLNRAHQNGPNGTHRKHAPTGAHPC